MLRALLAPSDLVAALLQQAQSHRRADGARAVHDGVEIGHAAAEQSGTERGHLTKRLSLIDAFAGQVRHN